MLNHSNLVGSTESVSLVFEHAIIARDVGRQFELERPHQKVLQVVQKLIFVALDCQPKSQHAVGTVMFQNKVSGFPTTNIHFLLNYLFFSPCLTRMWNGERTVQLIGDSYSFAEESEHTCVNNFACSI